VPEAARHFFILVVHSPLEAMGYVTTPELSSQRAEARAIRQHQNPHQQEGETRN
jgi:hypothetical protein